MKSSVCIVAIVTGFVLAAVPTMAATKVFLLGGQSNMAGVGGYPGEPGYPADKPCPAPYDAAQTAVKFWNYGQPPANGVVNQPTTGDGWIDLQTGFGYTGDEFGPELSFGYRLRELYPNDDIYLVKYGISSTSLAVDWNPGGSGTCYNTFKARVDAAIQNLTDADKSPAIAGMIWMQGDNDAIDHTRAAAYGANLKNFIEKVRTDFNAPNMPFVLGRVTTFYGAPDDNALVRSAQDAIPDQVSNTACFDTDDLQQAYGGHYGTQGQIDLGILFANEFVQTPEPSTLILSGAGLLTLAGYLWRRQCPSRLPDALRVDSAVDNPAVSKCQR